MQKWQKILMAVFGAAITIVPHFVKNSDSKKTLEEIEQAAGEAIGEVTRN